jgi:hypothetical protein
MNEKEQAELDKLNVDKEKLEADTYKMYVDMGVLEPYEVRFLKFGNTLDDIPVPKDLELPPVDPAPAPAPEGEPQPEDGEGDPEAPDDDLANEDDDGDGNPPHPPKKNAGSK